MQDQLTSEDIAAFTDQQLRDEMHHAAYVVATLFSQGLDGHARERLNVFTVLREESRRRNGATL